MYQLGIIEDIGGTIAGTNFADGLLAIYIFVKDFIFNFIDIISGALTLIYGMLNFIPSLIVNSIFSELPYVFRVGLSSMLTIFMALFILKLFQLVKFW